MGVRGWEWGSGGGRVELGSVPAIIAACTPRHHTHPPSIACLPPPEDGTPPRGFAMGTAPNKVPGAIGDPANDKLLPLRPLYGGPAHIGCLLTSRFRGVSWCATQGWRAQHIAQPASKVWVSRVGWVSDTGRGACVHNTPPLVHSSSLPGACLDPRPPPPPPSSHACLQGLPAIPSLQQIVADELTAARRVDDYRAQYDREPNNFEEDGITLRHTALQQSIVRGVSWDHGTWMAKDHTFTVGSASSELGAQLLLVKYLQLGRPRKWQRQQQQQQQQADEEPQPEPQPGWRQRDPGGPGDELRYVAQACCGRGHGGGAFMPRRHVCHGCVDAAETEEVLVEAAGLASPNEEQVWVSPSEEWAFPEEAAELLELTRGVARALRGMHIDHIIAVAWHDHNEPPDVVHSIFNMQLIDA